MKFFIKNFFSKCDQIRWNLQIWSHLLKKSLIVKLRFLCSEVNCILTHFSTVFHISTP